MLMAFGNKLSVNLLGRQHNLKLYILNMFRIYNPVALGEHKGKHKAHTLCIVAWNRRIASEEAG